MHRTHEAEILRPSIAVDDFITVDAIGPITEIELSDRDFWTMALTRWHRFSFLHIEQRANGLPRPNVFEHRITRPHSSVAKWKDPTIVY